MNANDEILWNLKTYDTRPYLICDYNAGRYLTSFDLLTASYSADAKHALRFATEEEVRAVGERYKQVYGRAYLIEFWGPPSTVSEE